MRVTPIVIDRNVGKTCVNFVGYCREEAVPSHPVIRIRLAGSKRHLVEYSGDVDKDGIACFEWDDILYSLPSGRYVGDLYDGEEHIGMIQIQLNPRQWGAEVVKAPRAKPSAPCVPDC